MTGRLGNGDVISRVKFEDAPAHRVDFGFKINMKKIIQKKKMTENPFYCVVYPILTNTLASRNAHGRAQREADALGLKMQAGHDRPPVVKTVVHSQKSLPPFYCADALPRLDYDDASLDRAASIRKNGKWSINSSFFARRGFGQSGHLGGETSGFLPGSLLHRALVHDLENGKVNRAWNIHICQFRLMTFDEFIAKFNER